MLDLASMLSARVSWLALDIPRSSCVNDLAEIQPISFVDVLQHYIPFIDLAEVYHFVQRDPGGFTIHRCCRWPEIIGRCGYGVIAMIVIYRSVDQDK